ncbi:MAG: phosphate ABC transporter substrate-binding protein PstS [Ignisphaera sp.]
MDRKTFVAIIIVIIVAVVLPYLFIKIMYSSTSPQTIITTQTPQTTYNVIIQGAGSTLVYPQLNEWIQLFYSQKGIKISYQSVGSGAGLSMFFQNVVDFACSDPPLSRDMWLKYNGSVLQIPWLAGAVAIVYNVPGIPTNYTLKLDGSVLADIYKGSIVYWDDPRIKSLNTDIADKLPHKEIIPVYRTDASGTTEIFTIFLYKSTNGSWSKDLVGKTVNWPVTSTGRGIGGKGSEGVTQIVMQTPYSIGYVEWSYAIMNNLPIAAIKNAAGAFVAPSNKSIMASLEKAVLPQSPLSDFSEDAYQIVYAPGEDSYPIVAPTHIILWKKYGDQSKALAVKEFLMWVAEEGYKHVIQGYVAPPENIRNLLIEAANMISS